MNNTQKIAPKILIEWTPVSNEGTVKMMYAEYGLDEHGNLTEYSDLTTADIYEEPIAVISQRTIDTAGELDPVTGNQFPTSISGAGIMMTIKKLSRSILDEIDKKKAEALIQVTSKNSTVLNQDNQREVELDLSTTEFVSGDSFVDITIDWGDGSQPETFTTMTPLSHIYTLEESINSYSITLTMNTSKFTGLVHTLSVPVKGI